MAKKGAGQRTFFRIMTVIGIFVIGGLVYSFLGAAPDLSDSTYHKNAPTAEECMLCHVRNPGKAPIMPHRPMGSCTFCHQAPE